MAWKFFEVGRCVGLQTRTGAIEIEKDGRPFLRYTTLMSK